MLLIKTVKYFVSGSDKYFEIYSTTVDEVEETRDTKDRKTITVTVAGKKYSGLYNKSVYEYLCENEGSGGILVLWPSGKGNYLIAYKWDIWKDYLEGADQDTIEEPVVSKEAFVYMWIDKTTDRKYIGHHKGTLNDGYIGSGTLFNEAYAARPDDFSRTILAYGTQKECLNLETLLLLNLKTRESHLYYNVSDNLRA